MLLWAETWTEGQTNFNVAPFGGIKRNKERIKEHPFMYLDCV